MLVVSENTRCYFTNTLHKSMGSKLNAVCSVILCSLNDGCVCCCLFVLFVFVFAIQTALVRFVCLG